MRILVVSAPLLGHLLPLLPLAGALRVAGHDVLLASGGAAAGVDTDGIELRDVACGVTVGRAAARVLVTRPLVGLRELTGRAGTGFVGELFGRVNAGMCDALVRLGERWRPDVVVHESLGVAGAVVAARLGVPAVLQENSLWDGAELVAVTGASTAITRERERLGLDPLPASALTIRTAPPSLVGGPRPGLPMRAVPHDGGGEVPEWLREPGRRVFVSRSTVSGEGDPTAAVVAVAEAVPAEFVLVRAPGSVTRRPLPRNVRATGWLPLARVLPGAAGFVHHGGAGGVLGALHAGVPQIAVPGAGDRRYNAAAVARRGVGLAVEGRHITAEALTALVAEPALGRAAGEVAAEMAAMPHPAELVGAIEALWPPAPPARRDPAPAQPRSPAAQARVPAAQARVPAAQARVHRVDVGAGTDGVRVRRADRLFVSGPRDAGRRSGGRRSLLRRSGHRLDERGLRHAGRHGLIR